MFGPIMTFELENGLKVKMAPIEQADMAMCISEGGLQSLEVTRYLSLRSAPTLLDEHEWYEKVRKDPGCLAWGIFVIEGAEQKLVGTSSYGYVEGRLLRTATSGVCIFNTDYWGKGLASACHKARTYFAFCEDAVVCIRSEVVTANNASDKALRSVGYTPVFVERNFALHRGKVVHSRCYQAINPLDRFWNQWWGDDRPPNKMLVARDKSLAAIAWAKQNVSF